MNNKKYAAFAVIFAVLAVLVYLQFRTWRNFDWALLVRQSHLKWSHIIYATLLTYFAYVLRAVRWKIFLRSTRSKAPIVGLIAPTMIGFTGLALLGRPGELIRPYLIARRENLGFASQVAVWAVERIFDFGGFAVLLVSAIFLPPFELHRFTQNARADIKHGILLTGFSLIALVLGLLSVVVLLSNRGEQIARWVERRFSHLREGMGHRVAQKVREFTLGLDAIHGVSEFFQLSAVSIMMWGIIAFAYVQVTASYTGLESLRSTKVLFLMFCSMLGSMVQLPGVGGGSQLATISAMDHVFGIGPRELTVSCGIMLWLVTFFSVVPVGLFLAHRERLSLRALSAESAQAEEVAAVEDATQVRGKT